MVLLEAPRGNKQTGFIAAHTQVITAAVPAVIPVKIKYDGDVLSSIWKLSNQ